MGERVGDAAEQTNALQRGDGASPKAIAKRPAIHELESQPWMALMLPHCIDLDDVGVAEPCGGLTLAPREGIEAERLRAENLEGDLASQGEVASQPDVPHPTRSEQSHDLHRCDAIAGGDAAGSGRTRPVSPGILQGRLFATREQDGVAGVHGARARTSRKWSVPGDLPRTVS